MHVAQISPAPFQTISDGLLRTTSDAAKPGWTTGSARPDPNVFRPDSDLVPAAGGSKEYDRRDFAATNSGYALIRRVTEQVTKPSEAIR